MAENKPKDPPPAPAPSEQPARPPTPPLRISEALIEAAKASH